MQISWQARCFRRYRLRSRCSTFARSGTDSLQVQDFRKVRYRFRGRRSTFARAGNKFVAGAALSRKVGRKERERERERESEKERKKESDDRGSDDSTRGALSSVSILQKSRGVRGGRHPPMMFEEVTIQQRVMMIEEVMIQQIQRVRQSRQTF